MELQSFPILIHNKDVADNNKMYLDQDYVTTKQLDDEDKKLVVDEENKPDEDKLKKDEEEELEEDEDEEE
ncbi:MAG TPA: hypothetical protein VK338_06080, partial [Candidatus Nitrosocosmicus sp.]|nr:hypothetical protein [Candidatus Nitrosocosmicus sp.]